MKMTDTDQAQMDLMKEVVQEMREMRGRITALESENGNLRKTVDNPETLMKKHGWMKFTTPSAEETFDPLNRGSPELLDSSPFSGSGDLFVKSRDEQLDEWKQAEQLVSSQ